MITANAPFKSPPRCTRPTFVKVLTDVGSPWAAAAPALYDMIAGKGHDPAVWLGIAGRETTFGTNLDSVFGRNHTNSWTNARSVRDPGVKPRATIITDPVRKSQYVKYATVSDSLLDGMYRVDEPGYAYQQAHAVSIAQVLAIWTESESAEYTAYVVNKINEWSTPMAGDDPRFQWTPDTNEFGYPADPNANNPGGIHGRVGKPIELLILHITAGTDSQSWLLGGHGSSTHYLTNKDGTPRAQHVADADAAWTPGSRDYALRSINVEVEMLHTSDWTDAIMRETARTIAPIMQRHNIPAVYLGRDAGPGKRGMIGHRDVPDPTKPGQWGGSSNHGDPGANFDWGKFAPMVAAEMAGGVVIPPDPNAARYFPETGHSLGGGFKDYWETHGGLDIFGYPLTDEIQEDGRTVQYFERSVFEFWPENQDPYRVLLRRLGAEALAAKEAA